MKGRKFLTSTLFIAAAAMSLGTVSAWATEHTLNDGSEQVGNDGSSTAYTFDNDTFIINSGTIDASTWGTTGHLGAWINFFSGDHRNIGGSLGTTTITGEGFLGLVVRYGANECYADLTNVDASGFTGQLSVINVYAKNVHVSLGGDSWANVEYVFGTKTIEWSGQTSIGTASASAPYYQGTSTSTADTDCHLTLELQGDTTLAGVTGTSKGFTVGGVDLNAEEAITVATTGATLTLVGEGNYEFYGTVGAENLELSISMGYTSGSGDASGDVGSQTFGGTNYLDKVTVNEGTLKLGGTTSIKGAVTVAEGAELDLSGTVTLTNTISNSGSVVIDSSTVFVLDNLSGSGSGSTTYTIISGGGNIEGWSSLDYSNFSISSETLTSDRQITFTTDGTITVDTSQSAQNLTWAGSGSGTWNSGVDSNTVWTNNSDGTTADYFVNGDNVTFSGSDTQTITISGTVHAATMTVSSGNYTFTNSDNSSLTVDSVSVNSSDALTFTGGGEFTIGDYKVADSGSTSGASLTVGEGTSVTMENYEAHYNQGATTLGSGATLTVTTQMWFATNNTEVLTGGTFNIEELTVSNYATVYVHDTTLNIGAGDASRGGLKADEDGHFEFGDNLTVGVYAGVDGNNTGWFTNDAIKFVTDEGGEGSGTTFSTNYGETITLGGTLTGVGFTNEGSGTLTLSGTVSLDSAITNSGNIVLADSVSIVLDGLTMETYTGDDDKTSSYYVIITGSDSGASVTFEGSASNFTLDGSALSNGWNIYTADGYLVIYRTAKDLTWAGTNTSYAWNYSDSNWSGESATFSEGDNVTFGTITSDSPYYEVNITTDVKPGSITVEDDYTFTTNVSGGVTVDAGGDLKVASGATLTIGEGVTLYIDEVEENFSVEGKIAGTGTIEIDLNSDYSSTINLGTENGFAGTVYIHSGYFHLYGSNIGSGTYRLGDGVNIEIATSGVSVSNDFIIEGTTQLHVNSGYSLTISGNISGDAITDDVTPTIDRHGAGTLVLAGNVDIDAFTIDSSVNSTSSTTTFSGSVSIGTLTVGGVGGITFSGGGSIGTLNLGAASTVTFTGSYTYTITEIAATAHANSKLEVSSGTTVNAGALTANWHFDTIQVDGVLNISGTAKFGTGSADSYTETFTGTGIVTIGTLQVGHDPTSSNGASIKIEGGLTFIVGEVTSGGGTNHYIEIANATIGTSSESLTFGSDENKFVLSAEEGSATIFNTSKFDVNSGTFTSTGATITIAANITGDGAMEVTGNGTLVLAGTSALGSVTVNSGATLEIGGTLELSSAISNAGTIIIDDGTTFALDNLTETYHKDGMGYYEIITNVDSGSVTFNSESGVYNFTNGDTTLSGWSIVQGSDGNIWIYGAVGEFTWAGDASNHNWSTNADDTTWKIGDDTGNSAYIEGSDVTFGTITEGSPSSEVDITTNITAGSITVKDNYTFVLSDGVTLKATYIDVVAKEGEGNYKLTLSTAEGGSATVLMDSENFYQFFHGDENQGDIEIGAGVTFQLSTVENDSASVTSASFSITGTGTLSVGATHDTAGGQIGLYLPDFEGTVIFREGTTYARFGYESGSNSGYTGVFNASATVVLEAGVGINIESDLTVTGENDGQEDHRILPSIVFEDGSHTIATNGHTAEFAGSIDGANAAIEITGAGTLTFSGDSVSFGSLTFSGVSGGNAATIEIGAGTTFTVTGDVIDATNNEMIHITLGNGSTMIVGGTLAFSPGSAANYDSTISGAGANNSKIVIGELVVGGTTSGSGGESIEISDVTLIVGALSFGNGQNSQFNLYLKDATLGFTNDVTIAQSTVDGSTSRIVLGGYETGNSTTTGSGTTTTINTSKYDVDSGTFSTTDGVTVTISQIIYGKGDLVVDGVGKLVLTAANQYTSSTTIKDGATVVAQNQSALGTGNVSVNGTLQVDTHVTTSGDVEFSDAGKLIVTQTLLADAGGLEENTTTAVAVAIITANTITFGENTLSSSEDVSSLVSNYITVESGYYQVTGWYYDNGTLYARVIPEPSMFGFIFGLGALALTATRRRRRQYRQAA